MALFDENLNGFPTIAKVALKSAEENLERLEGLEPSNGFIPALREQIEERQITGQAVGGRSKTPGQPRHDSLVGSRTAPVLTALGRTSSDTGRPLPGLPQHGVPGRQPSSATKAEIPDASKAEKTDARKHATESTPPKKAPLKPPRKPPLQPPLKPPGRR